jgi:hypothetical protein
VKTYRWSEIKSQSMELRTTVLFELAAWQPWICRVICEWKNGPGAYFLGAVHRWVEEHPDFARRCPGCAMRCYRSARKARKAMSRLIRRLRQYRPAELLKLLKETWDLFGQYGGA